MLVGVIACGVPARELRSPVDSAGVQLVEYSADGVGAPPYQVSQVPLAVFDARRADSVAGAELWHRGSVVAVERSDRSLVSLESFRVWTLDQGGDSVVVRGEQGSGPGELSDLRALCRTHGDTVVIYDQGNRRLSVLLPDGGLHEVRPIDGLIPQHGCFDDGTVAVVRTIPGAASTPTWRIQLQTIAGGLTDSVASVPAATVDRGVVVLVHVVAEGQRLFVVDGRSGEIRRYTARGRLMAIWRSESPPEQMSDREHARLLKLQYPSANARRQTLRRPASRRTNERALTWPFVGSAHPNGAGGLWVSDYIRWPGDAWRWTHFDSSGSILGQVTASALACGSARCRVVGFGDGTIRIARQDDDGFWRLTVHTLQLPGPVRASQ
jgi:hypothetical protein